MKLIYCYDAYCGWCYGMSEVIKRLDQTIGDKIPIEVLSGGMLIPNEPFEIGEIAPIMLDAYPQIEANTGIKFGEDYLWHLNNPDKSDWFPNSLMPAIALTIIKEHNPAQQAQFATDIEYALFYEGRDLTDPEAYRHLLDKYEISADEFYEKLHDDSYIDKAAQDFAIVKQLGITQFPVLLLQINENKFYLVAKGYLDYDTIISRIDAINNDIKAALN